MVRILKGTKIAHRPIGPTNLGETHARIRFGCWRRSGTDRGRVIRNRSGRLLRRAGMIGIHSDSCNSAYWEFNNLARNLEMSLNETVRPSR
jgi:hypothetical protein